MAIEIEKIIDRYQKLDSERSVWKDHWEDIATYCAPKRMGFLSTRQPGEKRTRKLYNPIGVQCTQTLAAALHGMVMNPATIWLSIRLLVEELNQRDDVRAWTGNISKRLLTALQSPMTAFHVHANQILEDIVGPGTGVMYVGQQASGPLYVRTYSIAECLIAENNYGMVDTVMRESDYTARQVVQQWGLNKVSTRTRGFYDKSDYDHVVRVVHSVQPRQEYDPGKHDRENKPYEVCYFELEARHELEESGVEEMPYVVPRWFTATGEVYGRSPAMTALPQIKVGNAAQKLVLDAAEKAINPPLQIPHEGVVSPVRTTPGGLTYVRGKNEIKQMPVSSALPFAAEWLQAINNEIRTTMFVDQVQFVGDFRMTATEVVQRSTERMRLLGPVLGRLENEFLNPLITRVFGIMHRMRALPPPPKDIEGEDMRIEYVSPLARAQKAQLAHGFVQAMSVIEPIAKANPDVLAPVNWEKVTPSLFDWFGVDVDLLLTEEQLAQQTYRNNMRRLIEMLPMLGKFAQGGGAGVESLANAGQAATEAGLNAQGMAANAASGIPGAGIAPTGNPQPVGQGYPQGGPPMSMQPGAGGVGSPDLMSMLGSLLRGGAAAAPNAGGGIPDLMRALTGSTTRPQGRGY